MKKNRAPVVHELDRLFGLGTIGSMTDSRLLELFLGGDDRSAALAFESIVERHGPMVLRTCRILLRDRHAAEDAFQATFLVLTRKAQSLRSRELLGNWLHGVAVRTARKARTLAAKQRARERWSAVNEAVAAEGPYREGIDNDLYQVLHEEIERLPGSYRTAIATCYLEGKSQSQAAAQLCLSESTIRGRLARARKLLYRRLNLRNALPVDPLLTVGTAGMHARAIPHETVRATARAALEFLKGSHVGPCGVSLRTRALANGELCTMWLYRLKTVAAVIIASGALAAAGVLLTQPMVRAQPHRVKGMSPQEFLAASSEPTAIAGANLLNTVGTGELAVQTEDAETGKVDPELAKLAPGAIVRTVSVSKDCMILSYLPQWDHGNVDNIGMGNNDGGNRTLIAWPTIPANEGTEPDNRFLIAMYSRESISSPPAGPIDAFEIENDWPERTSWSNRPSYNPEPVATYKFEPGTGWKLFDITPLVRANAKVNRPSHGVMFRFVSEELSSPKHSDYKFVSREATGKWESRRPVLLIVKGAKP